MSTAKDPPPMSNIFAKIYKCYKAIEIAIRRRKLFDVGAGFASVKRELRSECAKWSRVLGRGF